MLRTCLVTVAVCLGSVWHPLGMAGDSVVSVEFRKDQQRTLPQLDALLRDFETAGQVAASGRVFYEADHAKRTWGNYCANALALAERGERLPTRAVTLPTSTTWQATSNARFIGRTRRSS
jgi:hypothetical protein